MTATPPFVVAYPIAAMPARYAVERGDWKPRRSCSRRRAACPITQALSWYAQGARRRAQRRGRRGRAGRRRARHAAEGADRRGERLLGHRGRDPAARRRRLDRLRPQGQPTQALQLMREAADLEDRNEKHIVTPGRILPARELLGDMLLEAGQPAAALRGVRGVAAARAEPLPRLRGAARAAAAAGDSGEGGRELPQAAGTGRDRRHAAAGDRAGPGFPGEVGKQGRRGKSVPSPNPTLPFCGSAHAARQVPTPKNRGGFRGEYTPNS